jgi:hypothetical protein
MCEKYYTLSEFEITLGLGSSNYEGVRPVVFVATVQIHLQQLV